jgi:low density lipoprotein-related protein 2
MKHGEDVVRGERRVEALDFNPKTEMIFWADSFDRSLKRSFMVGAKSGEAQIGFAQDLTIKGTGKPSALAVDWLADNLYWTELDRTGPKPKGRLLVAKSDGRYKRSLITTGLEAPSAIVLDPARGKMFWADSGSSPRIEVSWMDGSKRRTIVQEALRHPTALAIDTGMGIASIYWADAKMNTIEIATQDGTKRQAILRGENLKHPISLDVFESDLFWATRDSGELIKQDKFGRGVPVVVAKDLVNPSAVKGEQLQLCNVTS